MDIYSNRPCKGSNFVERILGSSWIQILSGVKHRISAEKNILHAHSTFPFTSPFGLRNLGLGSVKMVRKAYY